MPPVASLLGEVDLGEGVDAVGDLVRGELSAGRWGFFRYQFPNCLGVMQPGSSWSSPTHSRQLMRLFGVSYPPGGW